MGWLGMGEIIVILLLALILFGPQKLPELGRVIGNGLREFKKATSGFDMNEIMDSKPSATETIPPPISTEPAKENESKSLPIPDRLTESPDPTSQVIVPYEELVSDANEVKIEKKKVEK